MNKNGTAKQESTTDLVKLHSINASIKAFEKSFGTAQVYCDAISGVNVSGMHGVQHAIGSERVEKAKEIYKGIRKGTQDYLAAIEYAEKISYKVSKLTKEFIAEFNKPMAVTPVKETPVKDAAEKAIKSAKPETKKPVKVTK